VQARPPATALLHSSETFGPVRVSFYGKHDLAGRMEAAWKERREHEKVEILMRFRTFAERSKWKKARLSRELGVSISTVERWLDGHQNILLASMLAIRQFLEQWESRAELTEPRTRLESPNALIKDDYPQHRYGTSFT
jgi:hypothetical protein